MSVIELGASRGRRAAATPRDPCSQDRLNREPSASTSRLADRVVERGAAARLPANAGELDRLRGIFARDLLEALVEAPGVRLLGLGERLEPLGELGEAFVARRLRHARVHLGVLVGLAGHGGLQIFLGLSDRLSGHGIADLLQEVEVAEGVPGLGVGGVLEEARHVGKALDVGDAREVKIAAVRLRLAGERLLEILEALRALEALASHVSAPPLSLRGRSAALPAAIAAAAEVLGPVIEDLESGLRRQPGADRAPPPHRDVVDSPAPDAREVVVGLGVAVEAQ